MKLQSTLAASLFAVTATLAFNAGAASSGASAGASADAGAKTEKAAPQKKMTPHSHVEVKTGFLQKTPEAMPDKPNPARDWSRHFHPRDGK